MKTTHLIALLLTFGSVLHAAQPGKTQLLTSPEQTPEGLQKSDWASIRAAHTAWEHSFMPVEGGAFQARNKAQQWTTLFDGQGFLAKPKDADWRWGLELRSYGFGTQQQGVSGKPEVKADGQRLTYEWDAAVQEWFVNDQRGLEHGFTVKQRPDGAAPGVPLDVVLSTRGTLKASVAGDAQTVYFRDAGGAPVVNYTGLKVWDADGRVLPSRFVASAGGGISLRVEEGEARYPITIDPIAQQAYVKPSIASLGYAGVSDQFGFSVAVSGDTVVVGAPFEDSSTTGINSTPDEGAGGAGAAYVYVRSGSTWSQQAYLKAAQVTAGDQFGYSVAVNGDTVVVGAYLEDSSTTGINSTPDELAGGAGAAYVYVRSGSTWSQQAYLKAAQVTGGDQFGVSVAVSGDTVVVGAPVEDSSTTGINSTPDELASGAGAAYVYVRSGSTWSQQAYLKAAQVTASDQFGYSVAVSGDTAVVGANQEDSSTPGINSTPDEGAFDAGAAYIFTGLGALPPPPPTVTSSTASLAVNSTTLTITGTGFDTTPGNNTVVFNNGAVGTVTAATATQLTVTFTAQPTTLGGLTAIVTNGNGSSGAAVQVAIVADIIATLSGGALTVTDVADGSGTLSLSESAGNLVISAGGGSVIGSNAGTGSGTNSVSIPLSSITDVITVNAAGGTDTINVGAFVTALNGLVINGDADADTVNLNGDVTFTAGASVSVTSESLTVAANADITTSGAGTITISADDMVIASTGSLVSASTVSLKPQTAARAIDLGTNTAGQLGLTDAELDRVTAGTLVVGDAASGQITLSAALSPAGTTTLSLITGAGVTQASTAAKITETNLAVRAVGSVSLDQGSSGRHTISTLAARSTGGGIGLRSGVALTVGTVDGLNGLDSGAGGALAYAETGNLVIQQPIVATGGAYLQAWAAGALLNISADVTSGGSVILGGARMIINNPVAATSDCTVLGAATLDLGSATDVAAATTELSDAELDLITISTPGGLLTLQTNGDIVVSAALTLGSKTPRLSTAVGTIDFNGGSITTTSDVSLYGELVTADASGTDVTANKIFSFAKTFGTAANPLRTAVANLSIDQFQGGGGARTGIYILEADSVSLTNNGLKSTNAPISLTTSAGSVTLSFADVSTTGTVSLITGGAGGTLNVGSRTISGSAVSLIADNMTIGATAAINASSGAVSLAPLTPGRPIDLGTNTASQLGLTDAELDRVSASTLVIGDANSGAISISAVISPAAYGLLDLQKGVTFSATGGFDSDVTSATVYEKIKANGAVVINAASTLTATALGGFVPVGADAFTLLENTSGSSTTGNFTGKPEGAVVAVGGVNKLITYAGGTGNDVVLLPATPTVTNVSPASGTMLGGTSVTITGTNFASGATVTIGGAAATPVVVVDSTTITCTTPPGTAGARDVVVTVSGLPSTGGTGLFTYSTPPTDIALTSASIAENNAANATVGTLSATDVDVGDTHTFTLVTGTGDTDNAAFNISGNALRLLGSADYETKSSYSVRVQADDGNGGTFAKALTVTVLDVNETPPEGTNKTITLNEGATYTFVPADFGFTDPLSSPPNNFKSLRISSLPSAGTLSVGGVPAMVGATVTPSTAQAGAVLVERVNSVASGYTPGFSSILSSGDGMKIVAKSNDGLMRFSSDGGATWVTRSSLSGFTGILAMSSDGSKMVATSFSSGNLWLSMSTDDGQTWTQLTNAGGRNWTKAVISAYGQRIAAAVGSGYIHTSTDGGSTWTQQTGSGTSDFWTGLVASDDGMRITAGRSSSAGVNQPLLTSTDGGVTWAQPSPDTRDWRNLASSADGLKLIIGNYSPAGRIFTSVDGGANWTERTTSSSTSWYSLASSADGLRLFALASGFLETSSDGGATWTTKPLTAAPTYIPSPIALTASTDGSRLAIADYFPMTGKIWTSVGASTTTPTLTYTAPSVSANATPLTIFTFQVEDDGSTANGGQVLDLSPNTISINVINLNTAPTDIALTPASITENSAANTTVGTLSSTDADAGDAHTYTLVAGAGDTDNAAFNISGNALRLTGSADYETQSSYSVRVRTTDAEGLSFEKVFTITVLNLVENVTVGFHTASGLVGNYYNGGTDAAGNSGPNVGVVFPNSTAGGGKIGEQALVNVPDGFTGGFSCNHINVAVGFNLDVWSGLNGTGTQLAHVGYNLNGDGVASATFSGIAKSVTLGKYSGSPSYDNFTFGSTTVGTPVAEPPGVTTSAATLVSSNSATLNATVNPGGAATTAQFEYGTSVAYGSTASITLSPNDGITGQVVSANLTGLLPNTTYYFRVTGTNSVGSRNGAGLTFATPASSAPAGANKTINVGAVQTYTFATTDWGFSDSDSPANNFSGLKVTTLPSVGTLKLNNVNVSAGQTISMASTPAGGTWAAAAGLSNLDGLSSALSNDGSKGVASIWGGPVYVTSDGGSTWASVLSGITATSIAISADGTRIIAVTRQNQIHRSSDGGATWLANGTNTFWSSVACSANGQYAVAGTDSNTIYTSSDYGANWTSRVAPGTANWTGAGVSADGSKMVVAGNNSVYTSTDFGVNWTLSYTGPGGGVFGGAAISGDGTRMYASYGTGNIYVSTDSGATWTARASSQGWGKVSCSTDGLVAVASNGAAVYRTTDGGTTWTVGQSASNIRGSSVSGNGLKMFAPVGGGVRAVPLYISNGTSPLITYTAPASAGTSSFTFQVQDDGPGVTLDPTPNTISINIIPTVTPSIAGLSYLATSLTINGTGFSTTPANNTVAFSPTGTGTVTASTATSLTVTGITGLTVGALNAVVTTSGLSSASAVQVATVTNATPTNIALSAASVTENNTAGATIGTFTTTDADVGDTHTYSLVTGTGDTDNAAFTITGSTLTINGIADYETKTSYSIRVRGTDFGGLTFDKQFTITVLPVNEFAPTAINGPILIMEDFDYGASGGSLTGTNGGIGFADAWTGGTYVATGLTFSSLASPGGAWSGSSGSRNFSSVLAASGPISGDFLFKRPVSAGAVQMFGLGGSNNQGYTVALAPLNDGNGGTVPQVAIQGGPGFTNVVPSPLDPNTTYMYRFSYMSGSITVWILTAAQHDNFAVGGVLDQAAMNLATIGNGATQVTGRATIPANVTSNIANLFTYTFQGSGVVMDRLRMSATPAASALSVLENAAVNSTVGTLNATDADVGDTFTYTLVTGAGDTDNASFNISGSTLRTSVLLSYETGATRSIRVRVVDSGGLSYEQQLTVYLKDVNETPIDIALSSNTTPENVAANTTIGTLSSTDPDAGNTFTYTLVSGTGSTDNGNFNILGNALRIANSPNFEVKGSYSVRVRTTDQGGLAFDKAFTINITDLNEAPTSITVTPSSLAENNAVGASAGTLTAGDPDAGSSHTFALVTGTGDTDNGSFTLAANGALTINIATNFEAKNSYSIRVQATDNGSPGLTYEQAVTVNITNVNEAPTDIALSNATVAENAPQFTVIGNLSRTDPDAGDTALYNMVGTGNDNLKFFLSGSTLYSFDPLDFESRSTYTVRVRIIDSGSLSFEKDFTITATNKNEMPTFTVGTAQRLPNGTSAAQTVSGFLPAYDDGDSTVTQALTFNVSNNNNAFFSVQPAISSTGELTYTPSGTTGVATVTVSLRDDNTINGDAALTTSPQTFTITVDPTPDYTVTTTATTVTVTNISNTGDTLNFADGGAFATFAAAGRTFSLNGGLNLSGSIDLTYASLPGITSIVINAAGGNDTVNVGNFSALSSFPGLTINGGTGDDTVNLNGSISFAADASLDLDLQNDDPSPGIDVLNVAANASLVTSGTGTITVKVSKNVNLSSGSILTTVNGGITVEANQQAATTAGTFAGISMADSLVKSNGSGQISIKGTGGNSGLNQYGVSISGNGKIVGGTSGVTSVIGRAGASIGAFAKGVLIDGASSMISANGADIFVQGFGGAVSTSSNSKGVHLINGGSIAAGSTGAITVIGTAGSGTNQATGVELLSGTLIDSPGGLITITGTGGGNATSTTSRGVVISGSVRAGNNVSVVVTGTGGGGTGGNNNGILMEQNNVNGTVQTISSLGGNISVTGTPGAGSSSEAIKLNSVAGAPASITTASPGVLNLTGDTLNFVVSSVVSCTNGTVNLIQKTAGRPIDIGGSDTTTKLGISDSELDAITAGTLTIGDSASGNITVSAAISPANVAALNLVSGGTIADTNTSGTDITVAALTTSGQLAPGASPGTFSTSGTHSFVGGSSFNLEIGGVTAGTQHDQLSAGGSVTIPVNVALNVNSFGGFTPTMGQVFTIISRTGGTGTFAGLPEGSSVSTNFLGSGLPARISYAGGDGDDVIIRVANPEISVTGYSNEIPDGDTTPRFEDGTDFGGILTYGGSVPRVFRIVNSGTSPLSLTGTPKIVLSDTVNFSVGLDPVSPVAPTQNTLFQLRFDPVSPGVKTCTVSIDNDDLDENPYTFVITGEGQVPEPVEFTVGGVPRNVVTNEVATDATGLGDGTQFDVLGRGGYLANNGTLGAPGTLKIGVGGVTEVPNNFQGYWKSNGTTLTRLLRSGEVAPGTGGALFNAIPTIPVPGLNPDGEVTILAALRPGSGSPAVTASDDVGMWSEVGGNGLQLLMREDDDVPGIAGAKVSNFGYGCYATATFGGGTGEAAFTAKLKGSTTDSVLLRLSITGPGTADVSVVAREKTAAPGTAEQFGPLHSTFTSAVRMDPDGNIVFGAVTRPSNKTGIWSQAPGDTLTKVFAAGDVAPDTGGATFAALDMPSMASSGSFTFRGVLNRDGDNVANDKNDGIWFRSDTGFIFPILRRGDSTVTGLPAGGKVGNVWNGWVNLAGEGAWRGWVDTAGDGISPFPADTYGIYTNLGSDMVLLISVGDDAPGVAGAKFSFMDHPVVGGDSTFDGFLAFLGNVTGGGVIAGTNDKGVWASHNGDAPVLVLRTGDEMPTSQGSKIVANIDLPGSGMDIRPWQQNVMDNQGRLLLIVTYTDGTTSQVIIPVFSPVTPPL